MSNTGSLALALIVAGCSSEFPKPLGPGSLVPVAVGEVRVVNAARNPFAYFAVAADLAPLLDPVPEMPANSPYIRVITPGSEQGLGDIPGRDEAPDGGVAVYLYAISADGERARFTEVELASGAEIRLAGGRIVVRHVPSPVQRPEP